jgi:rod shape-determining protein MreC
MNAPVRTASGSRRTGGTLGLRFALLAIVSVSLMYLDHRDDHLGRLRQGLSVLVYPLQTLVDLPVRGWRWASQTLAERGALLAENESLRRDQLDASVRLLRLATLESENARLRAMLDSSAGVADRVLVAEILAVDLDPYGQRLNLNRGIVDGVYVGQALLDTKGVVGQVVRVGEFSAEAVAITDADHALPVTVDRNGLRTIALGTGDSGRLRLPYLTNSADVQIGDLLVSSGLGGVFPAGYPVGRVLDVRRRPGQSFAEVLAEPAAQFDRDREVMLVWTSKDTARASLDAAAREDAP